MINHFHFVDYPLLHENVRVLRWKPQYEEIGIFSTETALKLSIDKWGTIVAECAQQIGNDTYFAIEDHGSETCALCEFFYNYALEDCSSCIIRKDTGQVECRGTDYYKFCTSRNRNSRLLYAESMLAYLRGLQERLQAQPQQIPQSSE